MNGIRGYSRISNEEMNKILLEKIPLETRLKSVYLPIIAMDCACYLSEDLLNVLRSLKRGDTRDDFKVIKNCVEGYRKDNYMTMRSDLYKSCSSLTKRFYDSILQDMSIYQIQYRQAMLNRNVCVSEKIEPVIILSYVIREIVGLVIKIDRDYSNIVYDILKKYGMLYITQDNHYCVEMRKALNSMLSLFKVPTDLQTKHTDMALRIFETKLNSIDLCFK